MKSIHISPRLLTLDEAARYLGVSKATLRDWRVTRRNLSFVKLDGALRVDIRDLDDYIERSKQPPDAVGESGGGEARDHALPPAIDIAKGRVNSRESR